MPGELSSLPLGKSPADHVGAGGAEEGATCETAVATRSPGLSGIAAPHAEAGIWCPDGCPGVFSWIPLLRGVGV
jgi:hypothetical protein